MYEIYSTKGFVISKEIIGEYNEKVFLYTKDFGFIEAKIFGSKKDFSKHKNFLQNFSFIEVNLIIAKNGFQITSGKYLDNLYFNSGTLFLLKSQIFQNILILLKSVFLKSVVEKDIFDLIENLFFNLKKNNEQKQLKLIEVEYLINIFSKLGYLDKKKFILDDSKLDVLIEKINLHIKKIIF